MCLCELEPVKTMTNVFSLISVLFYLFSFRSNEINYYYYYRCENYNSSFVRRLSLSRAFVIVAFPSPYGVTSTHNVVFLHAAPSHIRFVYKRRRGKIDEKLKVNDGSGNGLCDEYIQKRQEMNKCPRNMWPSIQRLILKRIRMIECKIIYVCVVRK